MTRSVLKTPLCLFIALSFIGKLSAQENGDSTILRVGDEKVSKTEFKTIYFKNNQDSSVTEKALMDYMDLFIDFKLKVKEAEKMGLDTTKKFKKEFQRYKDRLARPYLIDTATKRKLLKEAYRRTKKQVHASHILVRLKKDDPLPKDTAKAYRRIVKIKERVQKSDSSFLEIGKRIAEKDPKVQSSDLGYFDSFKMVYPFENAAYETKEGNVTGPVRTKYGYHLIKVHDKRPSQGRIKVAHIMKHAPSRKASPRQKKEAKAAIDSLYEKLQRGADFHRLARKHSDDRRTSRRGGRLPWFKFGEMLPSFSRAAFALDSNGAISEPVKTRYGWHIIKRLDQKPLPSYKEMKPKLEKELKKSGRSSKLRQEVIKRLKEDYGLQKKEGRLKRFVRSLPDSSFVPKEWASASKDLASKELFSFADTSYTVRALARHMGRKSSLPDGKASRKMMAREALDALIDKAIISYEKDQLKEKYPRYKALLQEYRDGILLFELMEKKVWNKALEDTVGLRKFYKQHKENYKWDKRLDLTYLQCKDQKAAKKVQDRLKNGMARKKLLKELRKGNTMKCRLDSGSYEIGSRPFLKKMKQKKGVTEIVKANGKFYVGKVHQVIPPQVKTLEEARGLVSSDYQDHLEERWVKKLRKKYEIEVNRDLVRSLAKEVGNGK